MGIRCGDDRRLLLPPTSPTGCCRALATLALLVRCGEGDCGGGWVMSVGAGSGSVRRVSGSSGRRSYYNTALSLPACCLCFTDCVSCGVAALCPWPTTNPLHARVHPVRPLWPAVSVSHWKRWVGLGWG